MLLAAGSLLTYLSFLVFCVLGLPIQAMLALVTLPFDRMRRAAGRIFRLLAVATARSCVFWRMRVEGNDRRPRGAMQYGSERERAKKLAHESGSHGVIGRSSKITAVHRFSRQVRGFARRPQMPSENPLQ